MNMLKKINKLVIIGCLCLSGVLVGCEKKKEVLPLTEENITKITEEIGNAFVNEDTASILNYFTKETKKDLGADKLSQGWMAVTKDLGNYQDKEVIISMNGKKNTGYVIFNFDLKKVKLFLNFNQDMEIDRVLLNYVADIPENISTDEFQEVSITVGQNKNLNGKLTLPKGVENPPVVIMIQGSGVSNMNEEIYANKPFEDIAHGLAKQGIASVRYDKRFFAYPESVLPSEVTLDEEYLFDVAAVLHQIEDMPVNHNQVYLLGHSQGGMIAPRIAFDHPEIKGILVLAGTPRGLEEVMQQQQENALVAQGTSADSVAVSNTMMDKYIKEISELTEDADEKMILNLPAKYWYQLNQSKAGKFMDSLKCDVLIIQGEADFQVFMEEDYTAWQDLTKGMKNVMMKSYPNLNHLFMPSINGDISDYEIPAHVEQIVIDDMGTWILERKIEEK